MSKFKISLESYHLSPSIQLPWKSCHLLVSPLNAYLSLTNCERSTLVIFETVNKNDISNNISPLIKPFNGHTLQWKSNSFTWFVRSIILRQTGDNKMGCAYIFPLWFYTMPACDKVQFRDWVNNHFFSPPKQPIKLPSCQPVLFFLTVLTSFCWSKQYYRAIRKLWWSL